MSQYSSLLPLLLGIVFFKQISSTLRQLSVLFFCTVVLEILAVWFIKNTTDENNLFLFHLHTLIETSILVLVYVKIFNTSFKKNLAKTLYILFLIFSILSIIYWEPLDVFPSYQRYTEGIIIILFCLLYFNQIFQELTIQRLERFAYFWLNSALLIYFSGTLFLFISYETIRTNTTENVQYYIIVHSSLNILLNLAYSATIWFGRKSISS